MLFDPILGRKKIELTHYSFSKEKSEIHSLGKRVFFKNSPSPIKAGLFFKMAKLVGVVHENEEDSSGSNFNSRCLARRQLPLTIEQDLTMIMALDDACLACCSSTLYDVEEKTVNDINSSIQTFQRKYEALNRDELTAALMVNFNDLMSTLATEVSCVGCRRSVEAMLQKLHDSGDPALEPLVITDDKVISVNRDHILTPQSLANLFCNQLHRLRTTYIEPITGKLFDSSDN